MGNVHYTIKVIEPDKEYLKTFEITSTDAFSGWSGLMVVFCFLKDNTAKTRKAVPKKKNEILMILL